MSTLGTDQRNKEETIETLALRLRELRRPVANGVAPVRSRHLQSAMAATRRKEDPDPKKVPSIFIGLTISASSRTNATK